MQYRRHFSVLFLRVQAACLTTRLSHGDGSPEKGPHGTGAEKQEGGRGLSHGLCERTGKDENLVKENIL